MDHSPQNLRTHALQRIRKSSMKRGLSLLREATECAKQSGLDSVQFSLELVYLLDSGLTPNEIRWLLSEGYLKQFIELRNGNSTTRNLQCVKCLSISETSCFCLTADGIQLAESALSSDDNQCGPEVEANGHPPKHIPEWRADSRELHFRGQLVKRFRVPAKNQIAILQCFQHEGWPLRIDNPLTTDLNGEAGERFHDAIKRLNKRQSQSLIRFHGDGTGEGVMWKPLGDRPRIDPIAAVDNQQL